MAPYTVRSARRRATLAGLLVLAAAAGVRPASAQTAGCRPIPNVGPREASSFRDPQPDAALVQAVARLKATDPSVHVRFSQCEVDSFTARPKPTVPPYAAAILQAAGLPTQPVAIDLLPGPTQAPKAGQDLDSPSLRVRKLPLADEPLATNPDSDGQPSDGAPGDPRPGAPVVESRTEPAIVLEPRVSSFVPPPPAIVEAERAVAKPILTAFLARHDDVFRMGSAALGAGLPGLELTAYRVGRFSRTVTFTQQVGALPVLESRTQVLFDANWNVIVITRTLQTPAKLAVPRARMVAKATATGAARAAVAQLTGHDTTTLAASSAVLGLDPLRRQRLWQVRVAATDSLEVDYTVLVGKRGQVLNVSDNVDRFTDAKTRRWAYVSGDQTQPYQVTSTGIYTRGSNTLRHDFFYLETDERGGGTLGQFQCTADSFSDKSLWRQFAWGTTNSAFSYIRHTHRSDRDFSIWSPAHGSGSFGESHTYYWARQFYQWMKPALNELGVLPGDASDYPKTTVVANACIDDVGKASSSLDVTIHLNEGEGEGKVRLADLCRQGNGQCAASDYDDAANSFITCEGGGCHPTPSVVQHELNHRILGGMFGVGSTLDCSASDQRKFLHEGLLGSVLPQAFWHFWYGVGFNPATDRLFTADAVRGRVHADLASNLTRSDYPCSGADDYSQGPYEAGRVAGQPLWEIFHGKRVSGNSVFNTWRPATDTDFLILSYWAADLMASSTYKDRWEFANRVMEILEISGWPTTAKQDYCEIFQHHELDDFIDPSYCS